MSPILTVALKRAGRLLRELAHGVHTMHAVMHGVRPPAPPYPPAGSRRAPQGEPHSQPAGTRAAVSASAATDGWDTGDGAPTRW